MNFLKTIRPAIHKLILLISGIVLPLFIQAQVKMEVEVLVPLTNPDKPIYVALDYNDWNPGDPLYVLKKESEKVYSIILENPPERFEYKFTQGSWMYVEGTPDGQGQPNRVFDKSANKTNHLKVQILGWEEQVLYDIFLERIPENTPQGAKIYISGNFNGWDPGNPDFELRRNINGQYSFKLYSDLPKIDYKFTRGDWESVEARESGKARPNRTIYRDSKIDNRAVITRIEGWEDLMGTLHIYSLFDFVLLFSVFQGILLLITIPITQPENKETNKWLLTSIAVASLSVLLYFTANFHIFVNRYPRLVIMPDFVYFLYAPIFYFYLVKLLFEDRKLNWQWFLFFIPFVLQFFVYLPFVIQNDKTFLLDLMDQKPFIQNVLGGAGLMGLLWNIFFWVLNRNLLSTYKSKFENTLSYQQNLNYFYVLLSIQLLVLCFWAFSLILIFTAQITKLENAMLIENSIDLVWFTFSLTTFVVGYFAIHHRDIVKVEAEAGEVVFDDVLESQISTQEYFIPQKEDLSKELEKLKKYIEKKQPYRNPKISLPEMASDLDIQPHLLSKVINDHFEQNFFDFINHYRVEEFKKMAVDPKNQNFTFLGLAYEVGFNSKTSFNRAFKKFTNQTPREYIESFKES